MTAHAWAGTVRSWRGPVPSRAAVLLRWLASSGLLAAGFVGVAALAVFWRTLAPGLSYVSPDGNELATVAATLGLAHPTGYPLYTWLGKAFTYLPLGDAAYRVNFLSAAGAAGSSALVVLILGELRVPRLLAVGCGLLFAFSPTLWSQATIAEVYAPNALFVALEVYLLLLWGRHQRDPEVACSGDLRSTLLFSGWALTYGLSLGVHLSGLGFAPAFAAYILLVNWRVVVQPWVLVPAVAMFLAGTLQYLWVPVRYASGAVAPDPLNPLTLDGFLSYTLDAFPQFRWAYPLELMPDRFLVYGGYVLANFGWPGVALAIVGAVRLSLARPRTFTLLALMWLVHVLFFMGYRAQDLDVFFIPSHLMLILALGAGLTGVWRLLAVFRGQRFPRAPGWLLPAAASLLLGATVLVQVERSWAANDRSGETEINDFYRNVFVLLPPDATLVGAGGVFGYDMFYYPLVYGLRPDVAIPALRTDPGEGVGGTGPVYSVSREGEAGHGLFDGVPAAGSWSVPVLAAPSHTISTAFLHRNLVLYRQVDRSPDLTPNREPMLPFSLSGNGFTLVGADLPVHEVKRGGTVPVRLYWLVGDGTGSLFSLRLGDTTEPALEAEPGFGLAPRYSREVEPLFGKVIVDEFEFVVLSSAPTGAQPLVLSLDGESVTLAELEVR